MERYSEVMGLPVLCAESGRKIGTVINLIFCPRKREVKGILIENRGHELGRKVVLLKDIIHIGRDAVIVDNFSCAAPFRKMRSHGELKDRGEITGLRIYSKTGADLGIVKDVLFDQNTGIVEGVEVSDGLLQDIIEGRKVIPLFGKVEFSDEVILVDREAVEEADSTGGGIKKLLQE